MPEPPLTEDGNIARRLAEVAAARPNETAVIVPPRFNGRGGWSQTYAELNADAEAIARGLVALGAAPGRRIVMAVKPGPEFLAVAFGLFRSRSSAVLIDPGMGPKNALACIEEADVDGVVGIPLAQAMRRLKRASFKRSRINVCVGRWLPGLGISLDKLRRIGRRRTEPIGGTQPTDSAAIIFTSGSTGPPKGVCYEHGMLDAQWRMIRDEYGIEPGTQDMACFPLFGLFNVAMGVTTIWPRIDYSRPATASLDDLRPAFPEAGGQAFASPAIWRMVPRQVEREPGSVRLPFVRTLSAGAPVPPDTLAAVRSVLPPDATFHTPYGATESLPACTIESREVIEETAAMTLQGAGTCVGRPFAGVDVKVIRRPNRPIATMIEATEADVGEIGEIVVRSPAVTREYFKRPDATAAAKIADEGGTFWHRIGDVGYFDPSGRLWFCGRVSHIVETDEGPIYPVCIEPILEQVDGVGRVAVVGEIDAGREVAVAVVSPLASPADRSKARVDREALLLAILDKAATTTAQVIQRAVWYEPHGKMAALPVDNRHNAKIRREQIASELAASDDRWLRVERETNGGDP